MATSNIPASETVRSEAQKLSPTLIIGLGGTGGDVLLRIRKKFFEKFGGIEEFPIVSYLWFDTDKNYKDVGAKQFAKKVDFSNTEERLITIADTGSITSHLDQPVYRNIASWWPTGLNVIPRLDDGAGQYRPYSRLGLFYHYSEPEKGIRKCITDALGSIQNPAAREKVTNSPKLKRLKYDAEIQSFGTPNVYIVGSLAGGTGSGLFIDIARIVKDLNKKVILVGFFLTSRLFPNPKPRMHANTYAALLEWDYYNSHGYKPAWTLRDVQQDRQPLDPPLFNYSYILDTPNGAHLVLGTAPDDHKKIYEMVAENVFKDFSHGAFAQAKRSARVNVGQFMGTKWQYPPSPDPKEFRQSFNRHYQSFGMASISVPHDRIITTCAHRLAADLVAFWKGEGSQDANVAAIEQDVRAFLPATDVQLDNQSVLERLDDAGSNGVKASPASSLLQKLCRAADRLLEQAKGLPPGERPGALEESIGQLRTEELNEAGRGQNAGITLRCIEQNADKVIESGVKAIERQCNRRIDEQKLSVVSTIMFADRIAEELEKAGRQTGERLKAVHEEISALENQYTDRLNQMRRHALWSNVTFRKQIVLDYDMFRFREDALGTGRTPEEMDNTPGLLLALRQKAVLEAAQKVYNTLLGKLRGIQGEKGEFRGGIIARLRQLGRDFDGAAERLRQDAGYFQTKQNEDLSLVLFEPGEIESKYYPYCVKSDTIKKLSERLKDQYNLTAAAVKDTNFLKQEGASGRILDCCREEFDVIRNDFHVIDVLFEHFHAGEDRDGQPVVNSDMARELDRVFASSRFWAYGGTNQMQNFRLEEGQQEMHVGLPVIPPDAPDPERTRRRREAIKYFLKNSVDPGFRFPDIPDTSEIIFYNDLSGIPLNFFESMYELREIYRDLRATDNALHLEAKESSKFEDVLIMSDSEKLRLRNALSCIVLGSIYDQLWVKLDEDRVVFGYSESARVFESHKRIGEEREAINYLQQRPDITEKLLQACRAKLESSYQSATSSDSKSQSEAREILVKIAALLGHRMKVLAESAVGENGRTGHWADLPLIQKMEYCACEQIEQNLHQNCNWNEFREQAKMAIGRISDFAEIREDGRYRLKAATAAAARS